MCALETGRGYKRNGGIAEIPFDLDHYTPMEWSARCGKVEFTRGFQPWNLGNAGIILRFQRGRDVDDFLLVVQRRLLRLFNAGLYSFQSTFLPLCPGSSLYSKLQKRQPGILISADQA